MRAQVLIIGAGIAGCVAAARLADRFDVILVEAGPSSPIPEDPEQVTMSPRWWSLSCALTDERRWTARPGRAVGGSSVISGGYFALPAPEDLEHWRAVGGGAWDPDRVASAIAAIAEDLDVRPAPPAHPVSLAFARASAEAGHEAGVLRLQTTITDGVPRSTAELIADGIAAGRIRVRSDCRALRVLVDGDRAVGVEVAAADGGREVLTADEIVLAGGGFGTARLLLASGIGPADLLRDAGIEPAVDLPGVGAAFSDHATVWVEFAPTDELAGRDAATDAREGAFPVALRLGANGGAGDDLEILACVRPRDLDPAGSGRFGVIVGLQRPHARGTVMPASGHPLAAPSISYRYLEDVRDAAALRVGVRRAVSLLRSPAFTDLVLRVADLDDLTLQDDAALDAWIAERLGSAAHTCGSAPMGDPDDPGAVVDGAGRVRGIRNLRIADTSILPVVPSRAPASAAMATGAIVAAQLR